MESLYNSSPQLSFNHPLPLYPRYLSPDNEFFPNRLQDGRYRFRAHKQPKIQREDEPSRQEANLEESMDAEVLQSYMQSGPFLEQDSSSEQEDECFALPNRTRTRPAFFQCEEDTVLTLHGGAITNVSGDDAYPVRFDNQIRIFLDVTSSSSRRFDNLGVEVALYKRSTGWFGCGWMFLPSFGMLSNYDMCDDNPSCPVAPGRQVLEFVLDPSRLFTRIFRMIHHDMSAYQLVVRLRDNRDPYHELLCATIQTRIKL
ncbi:unnamed protein product [Caenorhabditis auriculariae]|uniref:MD-2-related lipid-recognition domain-containing protein n=1 Tax=Caenorhabditis auriculariae TaxID=2777116 RepID=A0A8S1GR49_9PELO|nr:unnamed protein product [Caenorhabditis auriculariae]